MGTRTIDIRQPDFFVVGAAKSGTTALWKYFQQHPDIFVTKNIEAKELGYYSKQYGIKSKEHYLDFFKKAQTNQVIGEVCHAYLSSEESAEWIKNEVPNAKIIILLRNPVDRAYSLYNWMTMNGYEKASSFKKALDRENKILNKTFDESKLTHNFIQNYLYFSSGLFFKQVKRYYDIFGPENVLLLEHQDFTERQEDSLFIIFKFLGVRPNKIIYELKTNKSKKLISTTLQYYFRKVKDKKSLKSNLIREIVAKLMSLNIIDKKPKPLGNDIREELKKNYKEDVEQLSELCNVDFMSKWEL